MAGARRRSEIACKRINFNPLDIHICRGVTEDGEPCENNITRHCREISYHILRQGAHLFSYSTELREVLKEAASFLFCCEDHCQSDELVNRWVSSWQDQEADDRRLQDVIQRHSNELVRTDTTRRVQFENAVGRVIRSDAPFAEKFFKVTKIIEDDRRNHPRSPCLGQTRSNPETLTANLTRPTATHLSCARRRQLSLPLKQLPSLSEIPGCNLGAIDDSDQVIAGPSTTGPVASRSRSADAVPSSAMPPRNGQALRTRVTTSSQTLSRSEPVPTQMTDRRRGALATMGGALVRAWSQTFGPAPVPELLPTHNRLTPRTEAPPFGRTPEILPRPAPAAILAGRPSGLMRSNRVDRPYLTLDTTIPRSAASFPASAPITSATPASAVSTRAGGHSRLTPLTSPVSEATRPPVDPELANGEKTCCDICTLPFDPASKKDAWGCPSCRRRLHIPCYEAWNMQNIRLFRPTPCPYCRAVIRRPTGF